MAQTLCHAINLVQIKSLKKLTVKLGRPFIFWPRHVVIDGRWLDASQVAHDKKGNHHPDTLFMNHQRKR